MVMAFMWGLIRAVNAFKAVKKACGPDTLINVDINDEFLNQIDKDNKLRELYTSLHKLELIY